ncbi:MAG: hypothetical protein ACLQGP_13540 [Isosphaeraceae bacterium]
MIRQQYSRDVAAGTVPDGADEDDFLERPTRRFLIDVVLRGLDWNPDDPTQVAEEARGWSGDGDRFYFDYLGIAPRTRAPVILVEAKGYDVMAARRPHGQNLAARDMAELISAALANLKDCSSSRAIIAEWEEWLRDLQGYVASLGNLGQATLRRVVITAGRWLIIFEEPVTAFILPGAPNVDHIHCFVSLEDIIERRKAVFDLLHRQRLVDTLSLTMPVAEALEILAPQTILQVFRGVVVATRETGGKRKLYPTRSVWPSLIVFSSGRIFAITDYEGVPTLEEPLDEGGFAEFLNDLSSRGAAFQARLLARLGRSDLQPLALAKFPGFRDGVGRRDVITAMVNPAPGSTSAMRAQAAQPQRSLVAHTGEPGGLQEYIVVTGENWFYKIEQPIGPECCFHAWPRAREAGVAAASPHMGKTSISYTESGQSQHCSHEELRRMRGQRCHIAVLETHLCCRACIFQTDCWASDADRLPCPVHAVS